MNDSKHATVQTLIDMLMTIEDKSLYVVVCSDVMINLDYEIEKDWLKRVEIDVVDLDGTYL